MNFDEVRDWQGTVEGLLGELQRKIKQCNLDVEPPTVRTIRSWRSRNLLSQPKGQKFGFRQILEGLAILQLLKKGWTLVAIAEVLSSWNDRELEQRIIFEKDGENATEFNDSQDLLVFLRSRAKNNLPLPEDAVILLAQGVLRQYDRVLTGKEIVKQDDKLPPELHSAMCKLGRLYLEEGKCDHAACIHDVLERSCYSFDSTKWDLNIFCNSKFQFGNVRLIDRDLRVPTADCAEIANKSGDFGEDNVIENRLHSRLREATARLGEKRKHEAYTALRELLGRRSLIKERELLDYLVGKNITPLQEAVLEFFDPVPEVWLINGHALSCFHCGTLMRPHPNKDRYPNGYCPIHQCNSKHPPQVGERLNPENERLLVAKPQILAYWTAPAIDELAIFDEAKTYGLDAELYPESDLCDVAISDRKIGIDAKSYRSPVLLALKLNRSIGGLIFYRTRIVAITDELIEDCPGYISTVNSLLDKKSETASLQIMSVSSAIKNIQEGIYASYTKA
jgi:DNA-binding transcriptional MerR regulator